MSKENDIALLHQIGIQYDAIALHELDKTMLLRRPYPGQVPCTNPHVYYCRYATVVHGLHSVKYLLRFSLCDGLVQIYFEIGKILGLRE